MTTTSDTIEMNFDQPIEGIPVTVQSIDVTGESVNIGVPTNQSVSQYNIENLSELSYITVSDAIATFEYLPKALYIRGQVDTSDKTTQFYRSALMYTIGNHKIVNVQEPFTAFTMSVEEIAQSDLQGIIEPGKIYLLNGQNRFYNIAEMFTNAAYAKVTFQPIPVRYLSGILNQSFLERYQVNANDTTLKHKTMDFMRSVHRAYSNYIARKTIADLADMEADINVLPDKSIRAIESAANRYAQESFGVSAQYMSIVKLLNTEKTPDVLWTLMDQGWIKYEAAKLLVQACTANKLDVEQTLSDLIQEFDINQFLTTTNEDDKALITAPAIKKWRAAHEAAIKKAEKLRIATDDSETDDATADSETADSETDDETADSETATIPGSASNSQSGAVVPPIDTIPLKIAIHRAMGNLETISRYTAIDPVQNHNLFAVGAALVKIAAKQIEKAPQKKAKEVFDATYALANVLLDDDQLGSMLPLDLQNLSVTFQTLNEKAQHVLIEDDIITEVTAEDDTEVNSEYDEYDDNYQVKLEDDDDDNDVNLGDDPDEDNDE